MLRLVRCSFCDVLAVPAGCRFSPPSRGCAARRQSGVGSKLEAETENGFGIWFQGQCNAVSLPHLLPPMVCEKSELSSPAENGATEKQLVRQALGRPGRRRNVAHRTDINQLFINQPAARCYTGCATAAIPITPSNGLLALVPVELVGLCGWGERGSARGLLGSP